MINNPDEQGLNCDFKANTIWLKGKKAKLGLPSFIQSYFYSPFMANGRCLLEEVAFECTTEDVDQVSWNFDDPGSGSNNTAIGEEVIHVFTTPGEYTVTMTILNNGISSSESKTITILGLPVINLKDSFSLCKEESITLDVEHYGASYLWSDNSTGPSLEVSNAGIYSVTVTGEDGCENKKSTTIVECNDNVVYLPTAFSPNKDGKNDLFFVRGMNITELDLKIYNRYGELVFFSKNINNPWNGHHNGESLNTDVFIYYAHVSFVDGTEKHLKGNLSLIR